MIKVFASLACANEPDIFNAIEQLKCSGFQNIELGGGCEPNPHLIEELSRVKKTGVSFLIHNYFPPPSVPFVFNLGLPSTEVAPSLDMAHQALEITRNINEELVYSVHAPFCLPMDVEWLGADIHKRKAVFPDQTFDLFASRLNTLSREYSDVRFFVENNVLTKRNFEACDKQSPFLLVDPRDFCDFFSELDAQLLLDLGHLFVSCETLKISFTECIEYLVQTIEIKYVHVSQNDGLRDANLALKKNTAIWNALSFILKHCDIEFITLEVYTGMKDLIDSAKLLDGLINEAA